MNGADGNIKCSKLYSARLELLLYGCGNNEVLYESTTVLRLSLGDIF